MLEKHNHRAVQQTVSSELGGEDVVKTYVFKRQFVSTIFGSISARCSWANSALIKRKTAATNSSLQFVNLSSSCCASLCHTSLWSLMLKLKGFLRNSCTAPSSLATKILHSEKADEYLKAPNDQTLMMCSWYAHKESLQGRTELGKGGIVGTFHPAPRVDMLSSISVIQYARIRSSRSIIVLGKGRMRGDTVAVPLK